MARKPISASMRWQVFARDNFTCRYCGAQAGQVGVVLHVDHVVSVADGGDNSIDNLATACQLCNGGKGARSALGAPVGDESVRVSKKRAKSIVKQAESVRAVIAADEALEQEAVNLKCSAYGVESVKMRLHEKGIINRLCREFGADKVLEFFKLSASRGVTELDSIRYVCGIARKRRNEAKAIADPEGW